MLRRGRRLVYRRRSCFRTLTLDAGTPSQTSTGSRTPDKLLARSSVENPPAPGSPSALDLLCGPVRLRLTLRVPRHSCACHIDLPAGKQHSCIAPSCHTPPPAQPKKGGGGGRETSVKRGTAALRSTSLSRESREEDSSACQGQDFVTWSRQEVSTHTHRERGSSVLAATKGGRRNRAHWHRQWVQAGKAAVRVG
jgi:hypothetical protein